MTYKRAFILIMIFLLINLLVVLFVVPKPAQPMEIKSHDRQLFNTPALGPEEMDQEYWDSMKPVKTYLAEQEEIKRKKEDAVKEKARLKEKARRSTHRRTSATAVRRIKGSNIRLSTADLKARLIAACERYDISGADRTWLVSAGVRVASRESGNRPGAISPTGEYVGIYQFGSDWSSMENRLDADWSINRFVKVYKVGGKAKIQQHWGATL